MPQRHNATPLLRRYQVLRASSPELRLACHRQRSTFGSLATVDDEEEQYLGEAWLLVRRPAPAALLEDLPLEPRGLAKDEDLKLAELDYLPAWQVADIALKVACQPGLHEWWGRIVERLREIELDAMDALLALHCMVRMECFDRQLLEKVVDRIECHYFSMELGLPEHTAVELFQHQGTYQSLVHNLPLEHQVKVILMDDTSRATGRQPRPRPLPEKNAKKEWKTMDPVEMEEKEREWFEQGRIKVQRMRHVKANVKRMRPGKRLRAVLAVKLLQAVPTAAPAELARIAQICAFPAIRPLRGDMKDDLHEGISRRLRDLSNEELSPYVLAFLSAMHGFGGSEAFRAWRTKLLPLAVQLARTEDVQAALESQELLHPRLFGIAAAPQREQLHVRLHRATVLFVSVLTARQVTVDCQLFHLVSSPLKKLLQQLLELRPTSSDLAETQGVAMPLELLADAMCALDACSIADIELARLCGSVFMHTFAEDVQSERCALSSYSMSDVCKIAHTSAALCPDSDDVMLLAWQAAREKLKDSEPHLVLMLLNAIVRAGPEELLTSQPFMDAVDELLVQKLDYDPALLGQIGI